MSCGNSQGTSSRLTYGFVLIQHSSKAVLLDTLGNLPDADAPLTELVEENVVVKKFVYDNDVEPVQEIVVVKNTRLRSKKGKD